MTDVLNELDISEYDRIYTCGPEIMMVRVFDILRCVGAHGRTEFICIGILSMLLECAGHVVLY